MLMCVFIREITMLLALSPGVARRRCARQNAKNETDFHAAAHDVMGTTHDPQATAHQVAAATSVDALAAAFHCLESFEKRAKVSERAKSHVTVFCR